MITNYNSEILSEAVEIYSEDGKRISRMRDISESKLFPIDVKEKCCMIVSLACCPFNFTISGFS
jgi:hypothetical protein